MTKEIVRAECERCGLVQLIEAFVKITKHKCINCGTYIWLNNAGDENERKT